MTQNASLEEKVSIRKGRADKFFENKSGGIKEILTTFRLLVLPYWKSEEKYTAGILLSLVIALNLAFVYANVLLNKWSGTFYDALQKLDVTEFNSLLIKFAIYVTFLILSFLAMTYVQDYLSFNWRSWMTRKFVERWFANKSFYKSLQQETAPDNPDQRISQDISNFTSGVLGFGTSILSSIVNLMTFSFILWSLSPEFSISLGEDSVLSIPGYMLWLTIIYSVVATYIIFKTGKPLIKLDYIGETTEANFRYGLMRIVERKDEIALLDGEKHEIKQLGKKFEAIKVNYLKQLVRNVYINTAQNIFSNASSVFPLLAAAPAFFSGAITLGTLMQLGNAFGSVQTALMLFGSNYQNLASISAMSNRLKQLHQSTAIKDHVSSINLTIDNAQLEVNNLTLYKPNQTTPLLSISFSLKAGERLMVKGRSGIGKTTLIKTIAGIWPHATGAINKPEVIDIMPQKPYFPVCSLREAILYGNDDINISDKAIGNLLSVFNLSNLSPDLDKSADWNAKLSLGEQQRLTFIKIILKKPKWLILDEPTASLDLENQNNAIQTLFTSLPETGILTISHSDSLAKYHDTVLSL